MNILIICPFCSPPNSYEDEDPIIMKSDQPLFLNTKTLSQYQLYICPECDAEVEIEVTL